MDFALPLKPSLRIRLEGAPGRVARFFDAEFGGQRVIDPGSDGPPDVVVRFVESLAPPDAWDEFGPSVAIADDALVVIEGGSRAGITLSDSGQVVAQVESLMPLDSIRRRVVLPCVALAAHRRDAVILHASATCGPHGTVLLLGEQGAGKTGLVVDLVDAGHGYLADDQMLLTKGGELIALQGLLELRLDTLVSRPEVGRAAKSTGWRRARVLRSALRAAQGLTAVIPGSLARQMTGALRRMGDTLSEHCFLVEPDRLFPVRNECLAEQPVRGFLITIGSPALIESASDDLVRRWVLEEVHVANEPLTELMTFAARTSAKWERVLAESRSLQRAVVESATREIAFTRVRMRPQDSGSTAARLIAELATAAGLPGSVARTK